MLNLCGLVGGNTGGINCDSQRSLPKKFFAGGKVFQKSEYATPDLFQAALKAACKLPTGNSSKLFPFPEIVGTTEQTDALKTAAFGYGLKQITIEGRPGYEFQIICGQTQYQALRHFNRAIVPIVMVDDVNNGWGTYNPDTTFNGEYAQVFVAGNGFGDGSKTLNATVTLMYQSASDFHDSSKYVPMNFNPNEAKGLLSFSLSEYAVHAANVYHIAGLVETAKLGTFLQIDSETGVGAALATSAMWVATLADGSTLAITTAAYVAGKGWTITFDTTAYAALASLSKIFLSTVNSTALDAADVTGVENVEPLVLVKP